MNSDFFFYRVEIAIGAKWVGASDELVVQWDPVVTDFPSVK